MPRFEVGEEVIIKLRNQMIGRGVVSGISIIRDDTLLEYTVARDGRFPLWALDNKDSCKYSPTFPAWRIYKLEEE